VWIRCAHTAGRLQGEELPGGISGKIRRLLATAGLGLGVLAAAPSASADTVVFDYNGTDGTDGSPQFWQVPTGVTTATFDLYGAAGGGVGSLSGQGARVHAVVPVTPGAQLQVMVGGHVAGALISDTGGFNGGGDAAFLGQGGGGGSDVRTGADPASRILVAGGGGGEGGSDDAAGGDGGDSGGNGTPGDPFVIVDGGGPGLAGTALMGGSGGAAGGGGGSGNGFPGQEGMGGDGGPTAGTGGGGGGGGGLWGGGGGGGGGADLMAPLFAGGGGGGGGSSHADPAASDVQIDQGVNAGHGRVEISFEPAPAPPSGTATPPRANTRITRKPGGKCKKAGATRCGEGKRRKHRWVFRFEDDLPGVTFLCRLDERPFEPCTSPKAYKGLEPGKHTFQVKSVDANGVESATQTARFRVRGRRR
jgi:hypothetical protein